MTFDHFLLAGSLTALAVGILHPAGAGAWPENEPQFAVAAMPAEISKGADAVMRLDALVFTVESPNKAMQQLKQAVTIFNAKGRQYGRFEVGYDQFCKLSALRAWLFDAQGKKIRELKKNEISDQSAISSVSLYEDSRIRVAELQHDTYPYTVVFECETIYDGIIRWPSWHPRLARMPVERSSFEVNVPAGMPIRYHLRHLEEKPEIQQIGERNILRWQAVNLSRWEAEPNSTAGSPALLTAPSAFEIAGYSGDMSSWQSFGKWFAQLAQGRTTLPPALLAQVQSLTTALNTPRDKAKALYQYLQSTTRYVSVQLGIGGWQPFDATYVHTRGYGDCKALSNYLIAMLQAVGIAAYPVLIRHGEEAPEVLADFPSNQFNHMIACVPLSGDTLWLECTSPTMPFGHLGAGNEDRNVLVVTPEGGKLCRTPASPARDNQQIRRARVTVDAAGNAAAEVRTHYTGNQQDRLRQALAHSTPREREDWLRKEIDIGSFQITAVDFSEAAGKSKEIALPLALELPRFASISGTRIFLRPNLMERRKFVPPAMSSRTQPVDLSYAYLDVDSISYRLPEGFAVEAAFAPVKIETDFGSYQASADFQADGYLLYVRRLEMRVNKLPAEQYEAYRQFWADIVKADGGQVVLVRKN